MSWPPLDRCRHNSDKSQPFFNCSPSTEGFDLVYLMSTSTSSSQSVTITVSERSLNRENRRALNVLSQVNRLLIKVRNPSWFSRDEMIGQLEIVYEEVDGLSDFIESQSQQVQDQLPRPCRITDCNGHAVEDSDVCPRHFTSAVARKEMLQRAAQKNPDDVTDIKTPRKKRSRTQEKEDEDIEEDRQMKQLMRHEDQSGEKLSPIDPVFEDYDVPIANRTTIFKPKTYKKPTSGKTRRPNIARKTHCTKCGDPLRPLTGGCTEEHCILHDEEGGMFVGIAKRNALNASK